MNGPTTALHRTSITAQHKLILDGVGPVENRPSTTLSEKKKNKGRQKVTHDTGDGLVGPLI